MADKTIPQLDPVVTVAPTDRFGCRQAGDTEDKRETRAQVHSLVSGEHFILAQVDEAATPTLAFGDGDSGFFEDSDDSISKSIAGAIQAVTGPDGKLFINTLTGVGPQGSNIISTTPADIQIYAARTVTNFVSGGAVGIWGGYAGGTDAAGGAVSLFGGGAGGGPSVGGDVRLFGGEADATPGQVELMGGEATVGGDGGDVTIDGGDGVGVGLFDGGDIFIRSGRAASGGTGDGGNINLTAGQSASPAGDGGDIILTAGQSNQGITGRVALIGGTSGNTADGGAIDITGGAAGTASGVNLGGAVTITGGLSNTTAPGGLVALVGGAGEPGESAAGGAVTIDGGVSGSGASGNGGAVLITSGDAVSTAGQGGVITLQGGVGTGTGDGGNINLLGGQGNDRGGDVDLFAGIGDTSDGGDIDIRTGVSTAGGTGGNLTVSIGASLGATFAGGFITMVAGAGATTGPGGDVTLTGGIAGNTDASVGGSVGLEGGTSAATNGDGGDINLTVGPGTGSGADGEVLVTGNMLFSNANGPEIDDVAATATVPVFIVDKSDPNTGIGGLSDRLDIIVGGVQGLRVDEGDEDPGDILIAYPVQEIGITAFATGGQANAFQLGMTISVITTCATAGDSVKLMRPSVNGAWVYVRNDGVASCDIFPFLGDDLGQGVDNEIECAPGQTRTFISTSTSGNTWVEIVGNKADSLFATAPLGPSIRDVATGEGAATINPNQADPDTGLGHVSDDLMSIIIGGTSAVEWQEQSAGVLHGIKRQNISAFAGGGQGSATQINDSYMTIAVVATAGDSVVLPAIFRSNVIMFIKNNGANAADVFPASGDDLGEGTDTALSVAAGRSVSFIATSENNTWTQWIVPVPTSLLATDAAGPEVEDAAASATNPTFVPDRSDNDTGIGHNAADELSVVAGGVEATRYTELNSNVIQAPDAQIGLTAFATGGQGSATQVNASFAQFSTVATLADSGRLPPVFKVGSVITVKNDGAADMDLFPSSGDDLGAGTDTAVSIVAGEAAQFLATVADATWTQIGTTVAL